MKKHCDKSRNQLPELPDRNEIEKKSFGWTLPSLRKLKYKIEPKYTKNFRPQRPLNTLNIN